MLGEPPALRVGGGRRRRRARGERWQRRGENAVSFSYPSVIVDSPVRRPDMKAEIPLPRSMRRAPRYESLEEGLSRFRLLPTQPCENDFIVDFIARHSLLESNSSWRWKFDISTMRPERYEYRFNDDLQQLLCRAALIYGQRSVLVKRDTVAYMSSLMGPSASIVEIPEAYHHVMLDQPLAFVAALRALLEGWTRTDAASRLDLPGVNRT